MASNHTKFAFWVANIAPRIAKIKLFLRNQGDF